MTCILYRASGGSRRHVCLSLSDSDRLSPSRLTVKVKAHELRGKSKQELLTQLKDLKGELGALRVAKVTGGAPNKLSKIKIVRKNIARTQTVYRQTQRSALKARSEKDAKAKSDKTKVSPFGAPSELGCLIVTCVDCAGFPPSRHASKEDPRYPKEIDEGAGQQEDPQGIQEGLSFPCA